jgi:hypothetical protein
VCMMSTTLLTVDASWTHIIIHDTLS